jgi:hypothetical protein
MRATSFASARTVSGLRSRKGDWRSNETDAGTLAALVYQDLELDEALSYGDLSVQGDSKLVERFLTFFPLPEPAPIRA